MPWFYNKNTKSLLDAEEGSILHDVLLADPNFEEVEGPAMTDIATEATEKATGEAEDLAGLSKEELIHVAQLMGIPVRAKDSVAKIREKIEAEREAK